MQITQPFNLGYFYVRSLSSNVHILNTFG